VEARLVATIGAPPRIISGSATTCASTIAATIARLTSAMPSNPVAVARGSPIRVPVSPPRSVVPTSFWQIGHDLHQHRRRQRDHGDHRVEGARHRPRKAGADDHWDRRDPQGLRAQRDLPRAPGMRADGGYGRKRYRRLQGGWRRQDEAPQL
jgi:hypothetical protein